MSQTATKSVEKLLDEAKIFQIINPRLVQAPPTLTLKEALQLMQENKAGYIVIAEGGKAVGIFTETDVVRKILAQAPDMSRPVRDFMTSSPLALSPQDSAGAAIDLMSSKRFYHVPLVNAQGDLAGVLSVRTLIRFLAEHFPTEVYNLPPRPDQLMETAEGG